MPKNIGDHEGEQIIHKFDRFEKAKKPGIMTGTEELRSEKSQSQDFLKASSHFLLDLRDAPNELRADFVSGSDLVGCRFWRLQALLAVNLYGRMACY